MNSSNKAKRSQAYKLAKDAGLLDSKGNPNEEYKRLILDVTGKDKMSIMTPEEADRFIKYLEELPKINKSIRAPFIQATLIFISLGLLSAFICSIISPNISYYVPPHISLENGVTSGYYTTDYRYIILLVVVSLLPLNIAAAYLMNYYAKKHLRNSVRWVTATIVFTPLVSVVAYLLTWPKKTQG